MEKKKRRKKIDISLDTKNVDVTFIREEDGDIEITLDTPKVDAKFTKDEQGIKLDVDINDNDFYEFESNGNSPYLPKGSVWKITGAMLKLFLNRKFGKLKK
jgi:hypothetical protein